MSKLVDDLFKDLSGYVEEDTLVEDVDRSLYTGDDGSIDIQKLFAPIEESFPTEERLRSEEYLRATEEEARYEEEQVRKQREAEVQELAERGDIYAPKEEIEDLRAPVDITEEEAGLITPSKDESNIISRIAAAFADIKAAGSGLGTVAGGEEADFYASGKLFPPASGEEPGDPNYISAIRAENKRGREILRSLGRITGNTFDHSQFDFTLHIPTKESMDKVGEQLRQLGKSEEQIKSDLNDVRSFVARNEQLRRSMEQSHWNKVSEGLYSFDERVHDIYDRLDFVTKILPQQSAPAEILKGFFEGTLEHDINSAIGWLVVSNPQKAKKLSDTFTLIKQEIDDNTVDHGKAVKFAKDLAKIIGPMTKTMAKGAAMGTVVPGFGAFATVPDWASAEAGGIFDESVRAGVPPEDAAAFAVGGGILSGMVEQLQVGRLKDIVSGVGKDRLKGIMLEGVKKYVKKKGAQTVLKFGKDFAKQTSQEALQKFVTEVAKEANIASAGLSEKDVFDMFASGGEAFVKEAVETAPHMAALTAISMLTGLGVSKARKMLNPSVNRSIQSALEEQDLDYTPENVAKVLAEDPQLEERIKEQTTLKDIIESTRNFSYASEAMNKQVTPGDIQRHWKSEYNVPITYETAKEKTKLINIIREFREKNKAFDEAEAKRKEDEFENKALKEQYRSKQEAMNKELREVSLSRFDDMYGKAMLEAQNVSKRMKSLRENMPLLLEYKETKEKPFKPDTQRRLSREERRAEVESGIYEERSEQEKTLRLLKDSIMTEGLDMTKKNVIKHWRDITGEKISREDAKTLINLMVDLNVLEDEVKSGVTEDIAEDTPVNYSKLSVFGKYEKRKEEKGVAPRTEEQVRVRDVEQDREVSEPQVEEVVAEEPIIEEPTPEVELATEEVVEPAQEVQAAEEVTEEAVEVAPEEQTIEESVVEDIIKPVTEKKVKGSRTKIKDPWDYVDESEHMQLYLNSKYNDLSHKEKSLLIKKLKEDIKTTLENGYIDRGGNIIMDNKGENQLSLFFDRLTLFQNQIARETRNERREAEGLRDQRREKAYIEGREGLTSDGLAKDIRGAEYSIISVLSSERLKTKWIRDGLEMALKKDYTQEEVDAGIENVKSKKVGGEVESDIRRLFLEYLTGVAYESDDYIIDQIDAIYGDAWTIDTDTKDRVFTEEELEQAADEDIFFSITKEGVVKPTKEELFILEKAERDLEYFIPPALLDKMVIEKVDSIIADGEVIENFNGAIIQEADGTLKIKINEDSTLSQLAETLYHEIMGHAGVANVINNNSKLHKEALRLFKSNEALQRVNEIRRTYKDRIDTVRKRFGQQAADDMLLSEWMAHEMHDYMMNRDEQSIGAKLWNLFKDWLISKGWIEAKNAEEFMRVLTKEMRKVPPSKLSTDFHVKYQGPAVAYSLKERVAGATAKKKLIAEEESGAKSLKEFILQVKKDERAKERVKKEAAVKKEKQKKKEAVAKIREEKKVAIKKEQTAMKEAVSKEREKSKVAEEKAKVEIKEVKGTAAKEIKDLKEKHKQEIKELRRKINQQLRDQEVRIEEFHKTATQYAKLVLENKNDLNEFQAYLLRMRPKTEKGVLGAKKKTVQKLKDMVERQQYRDAKAELLRLMKSLPKEMTLEEKKAIDELIGDLQKSGVSKKKREFLEAAKYFKDIGMKPAKELDKEIERLEKRVLNDLDIDEMRDLIIALRTVIHKSKERQKEFVAGIKVDYQKLKEDVVSELKEGRETFENNFGAIPSKTLAKKLGFLSKVIDVTVGNLALTPDAIISERIINKEHSVMEKVITGGMDKSLSKLLGFLQEIDRDFKEDVDIGYKELKNMSSVYYGGAKGRLKALKNIGVKINLPGGKSIVMTPAQRISFILHSKNEHNYESILRDGFVLDSNPGGKIHKYDDADIEAIVNSATEKEKKVAEFFHKILNTKSREALLETSKDLQGYEMELVEDYFPLFRTDIYRDYLEKGVNGAIGEQVEKHLESIGALQKRKANARGTVVIQDAFKAFYDSVKITGGYMAYAKSLRVARRLISDLGIEQSKDYDIQEELNTLNRYLNDIEGNVAVRSDKLEGWLKAVYGNAAQAVLGMNLTVIARQIPSYLTIGSTGIDPKYMMKGLGIGIYGEAYEKMLKKIEQYSPQTHQRITRGTVNAELGDRANINEAARFFGKPKDIFEMQTIGIEKADKQVMVRIFNAAKHEIEDKYPNLTGDAKWEKIAERAEYIIKETQPIYTREHRSELGRSRNLAVRSLVAFTSVTNQLLKSYVKAYGRANRDGWSPKALKRFASDLFWINISATVAMVGVDELRDKFFGKDTTWGDRGHRALKYFLAPLYFSGLLTSAAKDFITSVKEGDPKFWNWESVSSNLLTGTATDLLTGLTETAVAIGESDFEFGDYERMIDGSIKIVDSIGKAWKGASIRNIVNYLIRPWNVKRNRPEVMRINKELDYRPFIPRTIKYGAMKYKLNRDAYDDYVEAVHEYVNVAVDRYPNFKNLTDKQKKDYLHRNYLIATKAMANYNMSDMVKIEEEE